MKDISKLNLNEKNIHYIISTIIYTFHSIVKDTDFILKNILEIPRFANWKGIHL